MQKQYQNYTTHDFLQDEDFLNWRLFQREEDTLFWKNLIEEYPEKKETIEEAIQMSQSIRLNQISLSPTEKSSILNQIETRIQEKKKRKTLVRTLSIAASIAALISLAWFTPKFLDTKQIAQTTDTENLLNAKNVRLVLANNQTIDFPGTASIQHDNDMITVNSGNEQLAVISTSDFDKKKSNKLIVPHGKQSSLILPDGTKVWLNSGTTLEYPSKFDKKRRDISVTGEIYIEVAKNESQPFFVNTTTFAVKVLGTRFNISAYPEETEQSVVLVEGSVEVKTNSSKKIKLQPDQMLAMSSGNIKTSTVDVYDYISWKDGLLQFKSKPLYQIVNLLERHYNTQIECSPEIKDMKCTGKLILFPDIDKVMTTFTNTIPVKYLKENNKIQILKKANNK